MKELFKPANFLLYSLTIPLFLLVGFLYAALTGAGKGQGLAGGAIVFGYGVVFAFVGFVASIFIAFYIKHKIIIIINRILAMVLVIAVVIFMFHYMGREDKVVPEKKPPRKTTAPAVFKSNKISIEEFQAKQEFISSSLRSG